MADGRRESSDFDEIWCADSNFGSRTVTWWFIKNLWNSKWQSAAILKIVFWLYLHDLLSDWRSIWYVQVEPCISQHTPCDENSNFQKFKMADGRYFENDFIAISQLRMDHPISMKFGVPLQILILRTVKWQSVNILQIQNGGRPPYLKSFFGYISTIYCSITVKFDMKKQNYVQILVTWPKYQNLKVQDGGRQPFWKWFHHYISAADLPISMKFGVPLHSLVPWTVN